jgi:hypothetical protein
MMLVAVVIAAACSSSRSATHVAPSTSSVRRPKVAFCDLYRRDAADGRLRNWNLNDNSKTPSYSETLRALADAAPPALKLDIARILSYYATPQPHLSPAEDLAALRSGSACSRMSTTVVESTPLLGLPPETRQPLRHNRSALAL